MSLPPFLTSHSHGVLLSVKVQPRASRNAIAGAQGNELKVQVTAPPVDSAANEALLRLFAKTLDCPRGAVQLLRGATSKHKQLLVTGMSAENVAAKLGAADQK